MSHRTFATRLRHGLVALSVAVLTAILLVPAGGASAADASDFDPGELIADSKFFDGASMTAAQVSSFMKSVNSGCTSGKTCILNYKQSIGAKSSNPMCKAIGSASSQTAAQIIYTVGKACGVSQKAIMVILQKEQSLITSKAPGTSSWWYAMGAGCPDSTGCTTTNTGLYEQVYYGAFLLKRYTMPSGTGAGTDYPVDYSTRYPAGKTSNILYHPNSSSSSCGTKAVHVKNQATHALYIYTPYTPNAAALKNLYGTGDKCSAYGNRNFWRLYTDWFGPTGAIGVAAIEELYTSMGGATSYLGDPVGDVTPVDDHGGGLIQQYEGGQIAWNTSAGVHALTAAFSAKWQAVGGAAVVGWPRDDITTTTNANGTGRVQTFDTCLIVWVSGKGTYRVYGAYRTAWNAAGGASGKLGWPLADAASSAQQYQGGWIAYDATKKATGIVDKAVASAYLATGGPAKWGLPTAAAVTSPAAGGGTYQDFVSGTVTVSSAHGARTLYGAYRTVWKANGGANGQLGWPLASSYKDPQSGYSAQAFDGGIVYSGALGKGYVGAAFAARIKAGGGVTGKYGFPAGPVRITATGVGQDFVGWTFASTAEAGLRETHGSARAAWIVYKADAGFLGWPIAPATTDATKVSSQQFENGTIILKGSKRAYVGEHFAAALKAAGGVAGKYGWPTSGVVVSSKNGGGQVQKFGAITLAWSPTGGTRSVYGAIVAPWYSYGAYTGGLGWPTTGQQTDAASNARYQDFTGGRLFALKTKHGYVAKAFVSAYGTAGGPSGSWGWPTAVPTTADGVTTQKFERGTATVTDGTVTFTAK